MMLSQIESNIWTLKALTNNMALENADNVLRTHSSNSEELFENNSPISSADSQDNPKVQIIKLNTSPNRSTYSHVLPSKEENIVSAIVLSKWDDIMGPQTVHVWFKRLFEDFTNDSAQAPQLDISGFQAESEEEQFLIKGVNYLSGHTVNYTGLTLINSHNNYIKELCATNNSSLFVVPHLNFVSQSLEFYVKKNECYIPYSFAVLVHYKHYSYFLNLFDLVRIWLEKMSNRIKFLIDFSYNFGQDEEIIESLLNLCHILISIKTSPLKSFYISNTKEFLAHPLLEKALTSHLQTSGCTVVMGINCEEINLMIEFLALFLTPEQKLCSRLISESNNYSFQIGLYVQGLLIDEFGCRAINSEDLAITPFPVTTVDLIKHSDKNKGVKQTLLHYSARNSTLPESSSDLLRSENRNMHQTLLYSVKESSNLVKNLLNDLNKLPLEKWLNFIELFNKKIELLSKTLLNLVFWFNQNSESTESLHSHLCRALALSEQDLLVVLGNAEKKQPGISAMIREIAFST